MTNIWHTQEGSLDPPGVSWIPEEQAWNFVLCSKNAEQVTLLLYSDKSYTQPLLAYNFDPIVNKSGPLWHCRIAAEDAPRAKYYAYRVTGREPNPSHFDWFDNEKILLDPYARGVFFPPDFDRAAAQRPGPNDGQAPLGVITLDDDFDWEGDQHLSHGSDLIIYEMHVRGFTCDPNSGVATAKRGTFAGVIEKIPHLVDLGVTAVELMPVFQFDPQEHNYWGYMTLNFFAPHNCYASAEDPCSRHNEFRAMVKALHAAGIEVILDVVYNHTAESDASGPTYSYKGIDNDMYYIASGDPQQPFANFTGCGNTLDPVRTTVRKLVSDSLHYWREEMHVDGFRFDLASIFARGSAGEVDHDNAPIFGQIASGRNALNMRLIAEPWDAAGTYQLGRDFPGWLWMQWNAKYRDALQRFVRGEAETLPELMTRIYGSDDLFPDDTYYSCRPWQSINYITSHDGSSLYDLVAYEDKYNWANGEENRDGCSEFKWNCGCEGDENASAEVLALRRQQAKNFFALLMLSNGTPMFRMGDEFLQTQGGNNNPYNQDNETSWLDWQRLEENQDVYRFVKHMIAFRKQHPSLSRSHFWREEIAWFGPEGEVDFASMLLAFCLRGSRLNDNDIYVMINGGAAACAFNIQADRSWLRLVDTAQSSPKDILNIAKAQPLSRSTYTVQAHSVVVLVDGSSTR